jgi:hypothetical protein
LLTSWRQLRRTTPSTSSTCWSRPCSTASNTTASEHGYERCEILMPPPYVCARPA